MATRILRTDKHCEICGKVLVQRIRDSDKYYETRRYCGHGCAGVAKRKPDSEGIDTPRRTPRKKSKNTKPQQTKPRYISLDTGLTPEQERRRLMIEWRLFDIE